MRSLLQRCATGSPWPATLVGPVEVLNHVRPKVRSWSIGCEEDGVGERQRLVALALLRPDLDAVEAPVRRDAPIERPRLLRDLVLALHAPIRDEAYAAWLRGVHVQEQGCHSTRHSRRLTDDATAELEPYTRRPHAVRDDDVAAAQAGQQGGDAALGGEDAVGDGRAHSGGGEAMEVGPAQRD